MHLEVHALERDVPAVAERRRALQLEHRTLARRHRLALARQRRHPPADHRLDELLVGELRGVGRGEDRLAAAQDGHLVGDRADLVELVRDQHDAQALVAERGDDREQRLDLLRRQHAGGLVEDHEPRPGHEDLEDLGALPLADRQVPHLRGRVHRQAELLRRRLDLGGQGLELEGRTLGEGQRDVLGDRERRDEPQVLEHHADAEAAGVGGVPRGDQVPVDEHPSVVRGVDAVDHLEERALARTVLTDEAVHRAGHDREVHVRVRQHLAEALGEAAHLEQSRRLPDARLRAGDGVRGHGRDRRPDGAVSGGVSVGVSMPGG